MYSTCTLAPEENEEVVDYAVRRYGVRVERITVKGLKARSGIVEWNGKQYTDEVKHCLRVWPQDNDSEGFFIARLVKE